MITREQAIHLNMLIRNLRGTDELAHRYTLGYTNMSMEQVSDKGFTAFAELQEYIESLVAQECL